MFQTTYVDDFDQFLDLDIDCECVIDEIGKLDKYQTMTRTTRWLKASVKHDVRRW